MVWLHYMRYHHLQTEGCYYNSYDQGNNMIILGLTLSPIVVGIVGIQLIHEIGHFIAAVIHKVMLWGLTEDLL